MTDIIIEPNIDINVFSPGLNISVTQPTIETVVNTIKLDDLISNTPIDLNISLPVLSVEFESICVVEAGDDAMFNQFLVLGEDIELNKLVYMDNGLIYKASQDNANKIGAIGILIQAGVSGSSRTVKTGGVYNYSQWTWDLSSGKKIYLGLDGELTQHIPSSGYFLEIGYPITATSIMIDIEEPILL